jgi:two-component system cell cycle sensor histidine kinase/response regulator CckA
MVVEDDPAVRRLVCVGLKDQGYEVLSAANGEDGLRVALDREGPAISLVISDVIMPQMGGKVMAGRLEAKYPKLKILFTSGYSDETIAHQGMLDPGIALLSKPFSIATLVRKVRVLLDAPPSIPLP